MNISSVYNNLGTHFLSDGDYSTHVRSDGTDVDPYLVVDMSGLSFDKIIVYNSNIDCNKEWLTGARIAISNDFFGKNIVWQRYFNTTRGKYKFLLGPQKQSNSLYLRIEISGREYLHLAEVIAYDNDVPLKRISADQSSYGGIHLASQAIDGDNTTFCHTDDHSPWLSIQMELRNVSKVVVINRLDCEGCLGRINGAQLVLSLDEDANDILYSSTFPLVAQQVYTFFTRQPSIQTTYVRIEQPTVGYGINLVEIKLFYYDVQISTSG